MKPNNASYVELHVPDFSLAEEFYSRLGFEKVWEHNPHKLEGYLVMRRENNILAFWCGNEYVTTHPFFARFPKRTPRGYAVELVIMVDDIESMHKIAQKYSKVVKKLCVQPWGLRDFRIEDPFGFYIRFTEPTNILLENENSIK